MMLRDSGPFVRDEGCLFARVCVRLFCMWWDLLVQKVRVFEGRLHPS